MSTNDCNNRQQKLSGHRRGDPQAGGGGHHLLPCRNGRRDPAGIGAAGGLVGHRPDRQGGGVFFIRRQIGHCGDSEICFPLGADRQRRAVHGQSRPCGERGVCDGQQPERQQRCRLHHLAGRGGWAVCFVSAQAPDRQPHHTDRPARFRGGRRRGLLRLFSAAADCKAGALAGDDPIQQLAK